MKKIISLLVYLSLNVSFAQENIYWKLKVNVDQSELIKLQQLGVNLDHGTHKFGVFIIHDFSTQEKKILDQNDFHYEVLIEDVSGQYLKNRHLVSKKKNTLRKFGLFI